MAAHSQIYVAMLNSQAGQASEQPNGQNGPNRSEEEAANHPKQADQPNQLNHPNRPDQPDQLGQPDQSNLSNQPKQIKPQVNQNEQNNQNDSTNQTNGQLSESEAGDVQVNRRNSLKSSQTTQANHRVPPESGLSTSAEPTSVPSSSSSTKEQPSVGSSMNSSFSTLSPPENKSSDPLPNGHAERCELFPDLVFDLKELFRLSVKFTRENENKAFYPSYDDRNFLYALNYQIKLGAFNEEKAPQLGALDFVGKDRRLAWKALGDLSRTAAMQRFISELNRICPSFKPFVEAHNQEKVERERLQREEAERKRLEEERRLKEEEEERQKQAESERKERQRQEVKEALKKQTFYQFQSYAQQQYPNDSAAQEQLIKSLEELHYQQFVQQIMQFQGQQQLAEPTDDLANGLQQLNLNRDPADPATASATENGLSGDLNRQLGKMNQQDYANNQRHLVDQNDSELDESEEETEDEQSEADTDNESAGYDNYEGKSVQVASPQMWCKKIIRQFKESISIDSGDCVIKVGHGETLTIRVPTVPEGNSIVWEFATDAYDIGFGLFFEPNENPGDQVQIQVSESEDEEEEEEEPADPNDPERGGRKESKKQSKTSYVLPIIPISRRDCHEEVYCGSHVYPGKGTYLLKFDNSYSLWRAKTLYYRVFFSS